MREWYVIRLGRPVDSTKGHIYNGDALDLELVEEAPAVEEAPRARGRNQRPMTIGAAGEQPVLNNWIQQAGNAARQPKQKKAGYGYFVRPGDRDDKSGQVAHTSKDAAVGYAQELAAKNPKVMYGVFECIRVFETTTPTIISKSFNDGDELVIESNEEEEHE
jgi:hypothetical protein